MHKITISVDNNVYEGLHKFIGQGKISSFINSLVKPYILSAELDKAYISMAEDKAREKSADEWTENLTGDINNPRGEDSRWS